MKKLSMLGLLVSLVCSISIPHAQEVTGSLEGRVLDAEGNALAGVGVTVRGSSLQGSRQAITDASGYFRVAALPVGDYDVTLQYPAHHETMVQGVGVRLGKTTTMAEITLQAKVLEMPPVVVYGERPLIDPTTATTGGNLRRVDFEKIPTARNYRSIISLLPQSNTSFFGDETNVGGATGQENMYYIDGINVTEPYLGATGTNLPYNFVKEIELKRGGYEAEFGRALGGIVNVVTGRGSNEPVGSVFGYYTSDALAGDPELGVADVTVGDFSSYDAGFSLSGPIVKDKLWYYLAYDRARIKRDVEIPGFGFKRDDETIDMFAGKLTWKVGRDTELVFTALGDPAERDLIRPYSAVSGFPAALAEPDPVLGLQENGGYNFSAAAKTFVGSRWLIDASVSFYDSEQNIGGSTERARTEPLFIDLTNGEWSGGYGTRNDVASERWAVQASATGLFGRHTVKAGVQFEETEVGVDTSTTGVGNIQFDGTEYRVLTFVADTESRVELPTVFVQDSWRATDRLRLNFGLRWDGVSWYGHDGEKFAEFTDQFQPRVGFTYQPGRAGEQQIFGSAGRFSQQYPLFIPNVLYSAFDNRILLYTVDPRVDPDGYYFEFQFGTDDPVKPDLDGVEGEHSDELSLGYERLFAGRYKASAIATYRTLRNAIRTGIDPDTGRIVVGNPGQGDLYFLPEAEREYTSLELGVAGSGGPRLDFQASWVISKTEGNAPGLFDSDHGTPAAGNSISLRLVEQVPNSNGYLPNDRRHVVKVSGSYRFDHGITLGLFGSWMEGTPLNVFGASTLGFSHNRFLVPRGSAGNEPSIWDLNLRLQYTLGMFAARGVMPRLIVDVLHLGSEEEVVWTDQVAYLGLDENGNQTLPNPNFGQALRYQPPTTVRLGLEVSF